MTQSTTAPAAKKTAAKKAPTKAEEQAAKDRAKAIDKAKYDATQTVVKANRSEWNDLVKAALAELGIDWAPPLTTEEKAKRDLEALLAANPSLAAQYGIALDDTNPAADVEVPTPAEPFEA